MKPESYIRFLGPFDWHTGRTKYWNVVAEDGATHLGQVRWFGRWRCYAFNPHAGTVYERACLRDIADFCEAETKKHRSKP